MEEATQEKRSRLTRADWQVLSNEWKASGMNQSQFCRAKGIKLHTFSYWHLKVAKEKKELSSFQIVNIKPSLAKQPIEPSINIRLPNGISLMVPPIFNKSSLKNLLELLGVVSC